MQHVGRKFAREPSCVMYLWAGSSPQGGTDWLLSMLRIIPSRDLRRAVEAADSLQASVGAFENAVEEDDIEKQEIVARRHALGEWLVKTISAHRQMPMALGSGDTSLQFFHVWLAKILLRRIH